MNWIQTDHGTWLNLDYLDQVYVDSLPCDELLGNKEFWVARARNSRDVSYSNILSEPLTTREKAQAWIDARMKGR